MGDDGGETDVLAWTRFLEFFREMPRGGPGDPASMRRALALMTDLPAGPRVLDLGCGPGTTSAELAKLTGGRVVAFDLQAPFVAGQVSAALGSSRTDAVLGVCGDMAAVPFASGSFDLVWSVQEPPDEIRAWWTAEYPDIGSIDAKVSDVTSAGFDTVGHFTLPAASWWENYYKPMLARIAALRVTWAGEGAGLGVLAQLEHEASMFERFGHTYSYEFIVGRRRSSI